MPVITQSEDMRVVSAPTAEQIRAILNQDPVWAAYAIADLQPSYAPDCRWSIADGDQGHGLTLLFTRLSPPALFIMGEPYAVAEILETAATPKTVYIMVREEHLPLVNRRYTFSADQRPMWRMALTDQSAASADIHLPDGLQLVRMKAVDDERIRRLYANGGAFTPDAFLPYQTEEGVFFGVADNCGELLAVGGTHVVDWQAGVGAIGNMYTHPDHRGRGLGTALLSAVVETLSAGGVSNIVLNVDQRNTAARRLYERHGFEIYCPYLEGIGNRK